MAINSVKTSSPYSISGTLETKDERQNSRENPRQPKNKAEKDAKNPFPNETTQETGDAQLNEMQRQPIDTEKVLELLSHQPETLPNPKSVKEFTQKKTSIADKTRLNKICW